MGHKKVMKDNNFLQINHDLHHSLITMEEEMKANYKKMVAADSMFLAVHKIIDYSLLLVIETSKENDTRGESDKSSEVPHFGGG